MLDPRSRCVLVVGCAYLVQGLVAAVGVLIVNVLAQLGAPIEDQVGVLASGAVPWVLKVGGALVLDLGPSWRYRVRACAIAGLQVGVALGLAALADASQQLGSESIPLLTIALVWVGVNVCAAAQDVVVDGLALDTLGDHRAAAATAMGVGVALGFGVLDPFVVRPRVVAEGVAAGLLLPAWWVLGLALVTAALLWMPGSPTRARDQVRSVVASEAKAAELPWLGLLGLAAVMFAATFANNTTGAVASEFLFGTLGWDLESYGAWIMPVAAIAGLVGAVAWGPVVAKLGPIMAALLASVALGLVWLGFAAAAPWWTLRGVFVVMAGSEGILQQALIVALHAIALAAASRSTMPTTVFVVAMAALNLPRVLAPLVATHAMALGWVGLFAACGIAQIVVGLGLWPLLAHDPRRGADT